MVANCYSQADDRNTIQGEAITDTITNRLLAQYLSGATGVEQAASYANTLQPNGGWADLSFTDTIPTRWGAVAHLQRLRCMAMAYRKPGSALYRQQWLYDKIVTGLSYYYQQKPVAVNWWFNQIGAPQEYMVILLLLKDAMPEADLLHFASMLKDETGNERHRGKNRVWVATITIHKGCAENNITLIKKGLAAIASVLKIEHEQGTEGIKADCSFHQHHAQLYSGGYGLGLIDDIATYMLLVKDTPLAEVFTPDQRTLLTNLVLQGHQLFGYRSSIDFGTTGRNITRPGHTANMSPAVMDKLKLIDPLHAAEFELLKQHLTGGPFPVKYTGNKFFWKSDIMTQHGPGYYLSAKIISKRTVGTESLNGENIQGYNLPMGATNIATTGKEYSNIFPIWDWTKVPGTTAGINPDSVVLDNYIYGKNEYGGGASDGVSGVIAFESNYRQVKARKAYFFMGDAMVCLGSGITSTRGDSIVTGINQCYLSGKATVHPGKAGIKKEYFVNPHWIYHDGIGYIFPSPAKVACTQKTQQGSWRAINKSGSAAMLKKRVFDLWINHGVAPVNDSYAYIVLPVRSLQSFTKKASNHKFIIVQNDTAAQAVRNDDQHIAAVVFYRESTIDLGNGLQLTSDKPILVIVQQVADGYKISVADPLYRQPSVQLTVNKKLSGEGAVTNNTATTIRVAFPKGNDTGRSVTNTYHAAISTKS